MLGIIVCISVILLVYCLISFLCDEWPKKLGIISSIVLLVALAANTIVDEYRNSVKYTETTETRTYNLVSLQDESQVSGDIRGKRYYLYASINTDEVYNFYYETEDGGFKKAKIDASKAVVYEKDDCNPAVVEYTTYTKSKMSEKWQKILMLDILETEYKSYKVYIPKGTLTREYSLDAQ